MSLVNDHFPFLLSLVETVCIMDHLRIILRGPRELDGPLLFRWKGGDEQLLGERNGISLHLKVILDHCAPLLESIIWS